MAGFRKRGYVKWAALDPAQIEAICQRSTIIPNTARPYHGRWRSTLEKLEDAALFEPITPTSPGPEWQQGAHAEQGDHDIEAQTHPPTRRPSLIERALGVSDLMQRHGWRRV